jgi:hypothetical protein
MHPCCSSTPIQTSPTILKKMFLCPFQWRLGAWKIENKLFTHSKGKGGWRWKNGLPMFIEKGFGGKPKKISPI